ncbi:MAG: hypothetical protein AAB899_01860 [Patescibacteria group bacterium]
MNVIVVANCHSTKFANQKIANWCWMLEITTALRAGDFGRR